MAVKFNILQCGAIKSGNFWLYKIIQEILTGAGLDTTGFIEQQPIYALAKDWELNFPGQARVDVLEITDLQHYYRISSIFKMPIDDIKSYASNTPHVWTHSPVCKRSGEVFPLFDKKVYIIRDPRDRAISASKYFCSEYMMKYFPQEEKTPAGFFQKNYEKMLHDWIWHVYDHIRLAEAHNIHLIFYERLLHRFQEELQELLDYLEIELDEKEKQEIEEKVKFENLKVKNPKHLRTGKSGNWIDSLTDEQIEKATITAGPLLSFLNYPLDEELQLPEITSRSEADIKQLKEALVGAWQ